MIADRPVVEAFGGDFERDGRMLGFVFLGQRGDEFGTEGVGALDH